ncbi:MAG: DNA-binding YbaB/EbfC family protein [Pirellulaceae bacterium]|jgi:DNA-binding YbaB/EbfC family protein
MAVCGPTTGKESAVFKGLSNLASLMRQASQMGGKVQEINDKLKSERVSAQAGGGMVEAEANGLGELIRVKIDPALVEKGEREMIEDLVTAAVNQVSAKAKQLHIEAMKEMTGGMDLPGLDDALAQITPGGGGAS